MLKDNKNRLCFPSLFKIIFDNTLVRSIFTVQANDLMVTGGYEDNAYFLEQVDNYSFNVDKGIVYKHS